MSAFGSILGYYLPNLVLARLEFVRQREILSFPDAADLLMVCVEAGLGLDAALVKVTDEMRLRAKRWQRSCISLP